MGYGRTPLIGASIGGRVEEVKALLKYGANVNAVDNVSYYNISPQYPFSHNIYACVCGSINICVKERESERQNESHFE
jgi:ankyrin repeat protein